MVIFEGRSITPFYMKEYTMKKASSQHKLDIYTELCPASAMAILGCGLITVTMGALPLGAAISLAGIAVGVAGPLTKSILERNVANKH